MPSGRDSFRRNRVAPFVLFYFTTSGRMLGAAVLSPSRVSHGLAALAASSIAENPYRLVLQLALHSHVLRYESIGSILRLENIHAFADDPFSHPKQIQSKKTKLLQQKYKA